MSTCISILCCTDDGSAIRTVSDRQRVCVNMCVGRVHMAVPVSGMTPARRERNGNKHKRLFMGGPGGLTVQPHTAMLYLAQNQFHVKYQ